LTTKSLKGQMASDLSDMLGGIVNVAEGSTRPASASGIVAEALAQRILGGLAPGSSLASEAEMATEFAVSRLTVREALKLLAGRGLINIGRGRRAIVRQPSGGAFSDFLFTVINNDPKGLFDLIELRMSVEVQAATLATNRAARATIAALESALQGMREAAEAGRLGEEIDSEKTFHAYDLRFHEAIALSSGNRLVSYLFEAMAAPLQRSFSLSRRGHQLRGGTVEDTIAAHSAILEAMRTGDPKATAAAMRTHLEETELDIRFALSAGLGVAVDWR
jgi:GntR family transcriptional repressor for pyruvate dehydrogenase complex